MNISYEEWDDEPIDNEDENLRIYDITDEYDEAITHTGDNEQNDIKEGTILDLINKLSGRQYLLPLARSNQNEDEKVFFLISSFKLITFKKD